MKRIAANALLAVAIGAALAGAAVQFFVEADPNPLSVESTPDIEEMT